MRRRRKTVARSNDRKRFLAGTDCRNAGGVSTVVGSNPSKFRGDNLPVERVSWDDARSYCQAIGGRLPTEAEWEYAARAGSAGAHYGDLDDVAWHLGNSEEKTHEVGQKRPNAFELYDMLGNVWQWTADWYAEKYYQAGANQDPSGPPGGTLRVQRGGSWVEYSRNVRASNRGGSDPGGRNDDFGLRCVVE